MSVPSSTDVSGGNPPSLISDSKSQSTKNLPSMFERLRTAVQGTPEIREQKKTAKHEFREIINKIDKFNKGEAFKHWCSITKDAYKVSVFRENEAKLLKLRARCQKGKLTDLQAAKNDYQTIMAEALEIIKNQTEELNSTRTIIVPITVIQTQGPSNNNFLQDAIQPSVQGTQDPSLQDLNRKVDEQILQAWGKNQKNTSG